MPRFSAGRKTPDPDRRQESSGQRQGGQTVSSTGGRSGGGNSTGPRGRVKGRSRPPGRVSDEGNSRVPKKPRIDRDARPAPKPVARRGTNNPHPRGPSFPKKMPRPNTTKRR